MRGRLPKENNSQAGVTLLEILISLVVIALGILGVSTLQFNGLKSVQDAHYFVTASLLADDMGERIRVNTTAASAYNTSMLTSASASTNCETQTCLSSAMASYDIAQWITAIADRLPSGAGKITYTAGSSKTYALTVRWLGLAGGNCDVNGGTTDTLYWCFNLTVHQP